MKTWTDCIEFHGHICPGLAIGYRAALEAIRALKLDFSEDEEVVCVTENDSCAVDAMQVMLGCTAGKGNLVCNLKGKMAFSFFNRKTGQSVRLVLNALPELERKQLIEYIKDDPNVFTQKPVTIAVPQKAQIHRSYSCSHCGESTMESMIRVKDGEYVCLDCEGEV